MKARGLRVTAALALALAVGSGGVAWKRRAAKPAGVAAPSPRVAFVWPRGLELTYSFAWAGESSLALSAGNGAKAAPLHGAIDLRADLIFRSYGQRDGATIVGVAVARPTRHLLEALGADVLGDDAKASAVLEGHEAIATIAPDGEVKGVAFTADTPETFRVIAAHLVPLAMVTLQRDGAVAGTWEAHEAGPAGRGEVLYRASDDDALAVHRTRFAYDALDAVPASMRAGLRADVTSSGDATLDARGWITSVREEEAVTARTAASPTPVLTQTTRFTSTLASVGHFEAQAAPDLVARSAGSTSPADELRALEMRVGAFTYEQMVSDLAGYSVLGRIDHQNQWAFRAAGLVLLHPETADELARTFAARTTTAPSRALILDVLSSAGSAEAQSAMRDALSSPAANGDANEHAMLLQRFSFVRAPDAASIAFVEKGTRDASPTTRAASLYSLGALAGSLAKSGRAVEADAPHADLRAALVQARTRETKRIALAALGNAGFDGDARDIARYATTDADEDVRAAAVRALRDDTGAEARAAVNDAVDDSSADVQRAAFHILAARADDADLASLASAVTAGRTLVATDADLVNAIAPRAADSADVRRVLSYVLDRTVDDLELAARIRGVLGAAVASR